MFKENPKRPDQISADYTNICSKLGNETSCVVSGPFTTVPQRLSMLPKEKC